MAAVACPHGGHPFFDDASADAVDDEALYESFTGALWSGHYRRRILAFARQERSPVSWTWAASFVPGWFFYRKSYDSWVGFLLLFVVVWIAQGAAAVAGMMSVVLAALACTYLDVPILQGMFGDYLLHRRARTDHRRPRPPQHGAAARRDGSRGRAPATAAAWRDGAWHRRRSRDPEVRGDQGAGLSGREEERPAQPGRGAAIVPSLPRSVRLDRRAVVRHLPDHDWRRDHDRAHGLWGGWGPRRTRAPPRGVRHTPGAAASSSPRRSSRPRRSRRASGLHRSDASRGSGMCPVVP
jgi:hypothetical protein